MKRRMEGPVDAAALRASWLQSALARLTALPLLLVIAVAVAVFSAMGDNFLTGRNIENVLRQSTYLCLVAMGQMIALLTGGFDLSVGTILALTSVVCASTMAAVLNSSPDMVVLAIAAGILAGLATGMAVGAINGIGVSLLDVPPFIMTLGVASIGFGIALYLTGGVPVYGMPEAFGSIVGFGEFFGVPTPIHVTIALIIATYVLLNWSRWGRYFYAVGGNAKAASLSGINTRLVLFLAYLLCATMAAISGILLTARLETGEANIGAAMPLESIAACAIGGASLRGGIGRVENVVLGTVFVGLIQNGMNLAQIESYLQIVVIGILLILAVTGDQLRSRFAGRLQG